MSEQNKQNESDELFNKVFGPMFEQLFKPESNEKVQQVLQQIGRQAIDPLTESFEAMKDAAKTIQGLQFELKEANLEIDILNWNAVSDKECIQIQNTSIENGNKMIDRQNAYIKQLEQTLHEERLMALRSNQEKTILENRVKGSEQKILDLISDNHLYKNNLEEANETLIEQATTIHELKQDLQELQDILDGQQPNPEVNERKVFYVDLGDQIGKQEAMKLLHKIFADLKKEVVDTATSTLDEVVEVTQGLDVKASVLDLIRKREKLRQEIKRPDEHISDLYQRIEALEQSHLNLRKESIRMFNNFISDGE